MKQEMINAGLVPDIETFNRLADTMLSLKSKKTFPEKLSTMAGACVKSPGLLLAVCEAALYWRAEQLRKAGGALVWGSRGGEGDHISCDDRSGIVPSPAPRPIPKPDAIPPGGDRAVRDLIFEQTLIRGRAIGDIRFADIDGIVATNAYEAALLVAIKNHATPSDDRVTVRDVIKPSVLREMVKKAEAKRIKSA